MLPLSSLSLLSPPLAVLPVLYSFRRCPYAMRARFALVAAGQRCELREVVLRDKPEALCDASSKATVPVLVDTDGRVIDQSLDIMRWALAQRDPLGWLTPREGSLDDMLALIARCDGEFKNDLDRYKYPGRHARSDETQVPHAADATHATRHRDRGAAHVHMLAQRLQSSAFLFGDRPALADMAIAPFVRQFMGVDPTWSAAQPWPQLRAWLETLTRSALWIAATQKYPPWKPGDAARVFPEASVEVGVDAFAGRPSTQPPQPSTSLT